MTTYETILKLAEDLISIPSTEDRPEALLEVVELVADVCRDAGLFVNMLEYNEVPSLYISTRNTRETDVLFNGHLDLVSAYPKQFKPFTRDGFLHGRGSVDMKLYDAVAIQVLIDLFKDDPSINAGCYFSCDEETGGHNGAKMFARDGYRSRLLLNGDAGLDYALVTGSKGILRFKMIAETQPGRPAYPWEGTNAAQLLLDGFNRIQTRFNDHNIARAEDNWYTTFSIGKMQTKQHPSCLPHYAEMLLGINFVDDLSYMELFAEIKRLVPELKFELVNVAERLDMDENRPVYEAFRSIASSHFDREFMIKKDNGSSDAKFFKDIMDDIIIVKMPGVGAHEPDERARLDGIMPMYQTLMDISKLLIKNMPLEQLEMMGESS